MLLFVKPAKSVKNVVWNDAGFGERPFHIAHCRAEIAAADARGHRDHALQIFPRDFGLAAKRHEGGDAFEWKQMAVRRAQ